MKSSCLFNYPRKRFSFLLANVPQISVKVRKEYLTQFKTGHGEYEEGRWVTVKSKREKALLFETLLLEYGALYDKLPLSAFVWKTDINPKDLLPLDYLQLWNCLSYDIAVIEKAHLKNVECQVYMKNGKFYTGTYLFTIDYCHSFSNELNVTQSEEEPEHKAANIIKLDNGQFCAQPNNRILWNIPSLVPTIKKKPYFKVCINDYICERSPKWDLASEDNFFYKSSSEKEEEEKNEKEKEKEGANQDLFEEPKKI